MEVRGWSSHRDGRGRREKASLQGAEPLAPITTATTVRIRKEKRWSRTVRSRKPKSIWPATTFSNAKTWTKRSNGQ